MEKTRYHDMLPHEIVARRRKFPVAFIGMGGLEWHGEHQAVGLDALKAEKLCELAAAQSGGFAMPTLWYGEPRAHALMEASVDDDGMIKKTMGFKASRFTEKYWSKTADEQVEFYENLVYHVLLQMHSLEMKVICILTGHYPLRVFAQPAVRRFNETIRGCIACAQAEPEYAKPKKDAGGDHAAKWETSYLSYLRPDCVDMSVYKGRQTEPLIGVRGEDPRPTATVELGRKACRAIVNGMVAKAEGLLKKVKTK